MTTNAGPGGAQEPRTSGGGSEGRDPTVEAAQLRALADAFERRADAIAIRYQDPERRWQETAWHRQRVRDMRADADRLDPRPQP